MLKKRVLRLFVVVGLLLVVLYIFLLRDLPTPGKLYKYDIPQTTKILDREEKLLYKIYSDQDRTIVPLSKIPKQLQEATIAVEDKDFYKHPGFNPIGGILRALKSTVFKQRLEGGSTITQQLIKNTLLTPERTVERKIKEIILAIWAEVLYSKDEILEMYLNTVPYGGTAWGVESAAKKYFDKDVKDLDLAESALLAGLPVAPTRLSPFGANPELAKQRQKEVLRRMVEDKYITSEKAKEAENKKLVFAKSKESIKAPHFVMFVREKLAEEYGESLVERGGLKVVTTLDSSIQEMAQLSVASEVAKLEKYKVGNGAALVTKPSTGEILAMVGSKNYFAADSGRFNVTTAKRQPGSSIKPIMYAAGFETKKITPASVINDVPTCFRVVGQPLYCPRNYDGKFHGVTQVRFALANSYNLPAVKTLSYIGVDTMIATASAMGIDTFKDSSRYGLSLTLGGGEVTMLDMAEAFGVFANGGIRKDLIYVLRVEDSSGNILFEEDEDKLNISSPLEINGPRVLSAETAFLISHILYDNNARAQAFGTNSLLVVRGHPEVSVKTGTTNDLRDNWTIGYNQDYLVASWVGNNDNSPMNPYLVSGITGAAPIWNKIMTNLLKGRKQAWPAKPDGVIGKNICALSGKLPQQGEEICQNRFEYFILGTSPTEVEGVVRKQIPIDKTNGQMTNPEKTPPENIEMQEHDIIYDILGTPYCLDCPIPETPYIINISAK
jgi:1A family penicillin-binding protein